MPLGIQDQNTYRPFMATEHGSIAEIHIVAFINEYVLSISLNRPKTTFFDSHSVGINQ